MDGWMDGRTDEWRTISTNMYSNTLAIGEREVGGGFHVIFFCFCFFCAVFISCVFFFFFEVALAWLLYIL